MLPSAAHILKFKLGIFSPFSPTLKMHVLGLFVTKHTKVQKSEWPCDVNFSLFFLKKKKYVKTF